MSEKPQGKAPRPVREQGGTDEEAGQLGVDDRGNITWQWKGSGDLLADDAVGAAERMSALLDTTLTLSDDEELPADPAGGGAVAPKSGYDPYRREDVGRKPQRGKKKDLKQLSEWIELRRKLADKPKGD